MMLQVADDQILRSDPETDVLYEIVMQGTRLKVVTQVVEIGLFDKIEEFGESVTAEDLSKRCGYKADLTERVLNALVCYKLLQKNATEDKCRYALTPGSQKYLTRSKQKTMISFFTVEPQLLLPMFDNLKRSLETGSNKDVYESVLRYKDRGVNKYQLNNHGNDQKPAAELETNESFMSLMDAYMIGSAPAIAEAFDLSNHENVLDLGGGSGYMMYEFVRKYPKMSAVVFDIPETVEMAKNQQPEHTKENVKFVAGDFFVNSLPSADLVVLGHIVHNWNKHKIDVILSNVFNTMSPGGRILLAEKLLNGDKTGPEESIWFDVGMLVLTEEGRERTGAEYKSLLEEHGFRDVEIKIINGANSYDVISGRKPC